MWPDISLSFFHYVRCSTLNCEVVLELLSSKLQDPSNTVKMVTRPTKDPSFLCVVMQSLVTRLLSCMMQRALCAVSCLLTSDLLSLEQMFGATQRRLRQLSGGAPGPVANKATKVGKSREKTARPILSS